MGLPNDDPVIIRPPENAGEPTVITISCPDKIGLGCDLCRVILFFGLSIVRGDVSTDGKWCFILFWVEEGMGRASETRWGILKKRLLEACPVASSDSGIYSSYYRQQEIMEMEKQPQVFLLKFSCYDRTGLLHDVTRVLCELELTIRRVKVSTTPDGMVMDLFFITDTRELLHTRKRKDDTCDQLKAVLGECMTSCDIEQVFEDITARLHASFTLPSSITEEMFTLELPEEQSRPVIPASSRLSVTMDNSLSPAHTLIQIHCPDHKALLYDIMRTLKDYNIQISYGRFYSSQGSDCEIDLFVMQMDGKKIVDPNKQKALSGRLMMNLFVPLRVALVNRGPDLELFIANPVELSGKGRPLVLYDITLALKVLQICIFLAEIGRHTIGDCEWEVYRILINDDHDLSSSKNKIVECYKDVDGVGLMIMEVPSSSGPIHISLLM